MELLGKFSSVFQTTRHQCEAQETTQIMVDNVLLHENPVQKKAMERANYLEEASSQFETVKINHVEEQRNCCCNVL